MSMQFDVDGLKDCDQLVLERLQQSSSIGQEKGMHMDELCQQLKLPMEKINPGGCTMAGAQDQLRKLNETVTRIKGVIQDAEEQAQKQNHQIEDWLMKLREAVYDAEDLLDDFSTQALRKQLMPGKRVSREVRLLFSRSNQFVYGLRMVHRVKALRERLGD
ncbi:putative disease resistance protein At1g50180 [Populus nigra]|uniref:putative disease resistance protein At1g50180 n=1 Tax=Populus nigra TaxID=3691 RepID=UPI002B26CB7E|nr:putative disease resistance protein At1g50180 [Populus nigra]